VQQQGISKCHSTVFATLSRLYADRDYAAALVMDRKELAKMFVTLKNLYETHRKVGQKVASEGEFTSYLILFKACPYSFE
jgi:hypothetical protein